MKNKKIKYIKDMLNAVKEKRRADEIKEFGRLLSYANIVRNRKKYTRKRKHTKEWTDE